MRLEHGNDWSTLKEGKQTMVIQDMGYEIDYLAVGDGEKSGDAIAMRWGYLRRSLPKQRVIVIDGGTKESGQALVEHIRGYYQTDEVDLVVCTHCDADHASGLSVVIEKLQVGTLLMHEPWVHADEIHRLVKDRRTTVRSIAQKMEAGLEAAHDLWELARRKRVRIVEPFSGSTCPDVPELIVLGPERSWYKQLLSKFRCVPNTEASNNVLLATMPQQGPSLPVPNPFGSIAPPKSSLIQNTPALGAAPRVHQTDHAPDSSPTTSAENNSSAIIFLTILGRKMVFTGDAGVEALTHAIDYGQRRGLDFSNLELFHVPHHGSERNINSSVLGRIRTRVAVVSAAPDGAPKHPSSKVTNALIDCGTTVFLTQGQAFCHSLNAPLRFGWGLATPVPYDQILRFRDLLAGTAV